MMTGEAAEVAAWEAGGGLAGATRSYVCPARDQVFLMPACMRDWLEEGHLAWFVLDAVVELDTAALHRRPGGAPGRPPYEPEMMLALLLYAYCCAMRSSRRIEAACRTDAAFRVICGGLVPDHATIARFVVDQERALEGLFAAGLRLCAAAGLVDLSVLALDGTKVGADAALARNRDGAWIGREVARLMAATARDEAPCLAEAAALPGAQTADGACCASGRLGRLKAALAVIEAEDAAAAAEAKRLSQAAAADAEQGRLRKGRKPVEPLAALARAQIDQRVTLARVAEMQAAAQAKREASARGEKLHAPPPCRIQRAKADFGTNAGRACRRPGRH